MPVSLFVGCRQHVVEAGKTVAAVLQEQELDPLITAVQVNEELVRGERLRTTVLRDGDVVECVVQCAGGQAVESKKEGRNVAQPVTSVKRVVLVHRGTAAAEELASQLRDSLGETASVLVTDLSTAAGNVFIPLTLIKSLTRYGDRCLPALLVDDVIVRQGRLPDHASALQLVDHPVPDRSGELELDLMLVQVRAAEAEGCCGPGGCACDCR